MFSIRIEYEKPTRISHTNSRYRSIHGPVTLMIDVEAFLNELEALVYELTRRRPEDWNKCSFLLLTCTAATMEQA